MKVLLWIFLLSLSSVNTYAEILMGANDFTFSDGDKSIKVWYYNPSKNISKDIPILFVMHGAKRNAEDYRNDWIRYAKKNNFLLVAPEFSRKDFRGQRYITGNMMSSYGDIKAKDKWSFMIIEKIFNKIKFDANIATKKYYLYGHSGGAQFVHRFVQFFPEASLELAIEANAGWYTLLDKNISFPYGIKNLDIDTEGLKEIFSKKLIVLLGTEDTDMFHKALRNTPEAVEQGDHRFDRGNNYFKYSKKLAEEIGAVFNWKMFYVEGVGHSNSGMAEEAYKFIK